MDSWFTVLCSFQVYSKVIQLYVHMYLFFFKLFSHLGYYRILSRAPCPIQEVLVGYLFSILCVYINPKILILPSALSCQYRVCPRENSNGSYWEFQRARLCLPLLTLHRPWSLPAVGVEADPPNFNRCSHVDLPCFLMRTCWPLRVLLLWDPTMLHCITFFLHRG